jgi:hypothetical protein
MTSPLSEHGPIRGNVFTEPMPRSGLHNPVVPPLLGADDIENKPSSIAACWTVFTELLPGNAFIKSLTICYLTIQVVSCSELGKLPHHHSPYALNGILFFSVFGVAAAFEGSRIP